MAEFAEAKVMSVSMKADVNLNGNIAQVGDDVAGAKVITIDGIKKNATLAESEKVFDAFLGGICGGSADSLSAVRTIKEGVAQ